MILSMYRKNLVVPISTIPCVTWFNGSKSRWTNRQSTTIKLRKFQWPGSQTHLQSLFSKFAVLQLVEQSLFCFSVKPVASRINLPPQVHESRRHGNHYSSRLQAITQQMLPNHFHAAKTQGSINSVQLLVKVLLAFSIVPENAWISSKQSFQKNTIDTELEDAAKVTVSCRLRRTMND